MTKPYSVRIEDLVVPENRQRREVDEEAIMELATSISKNSLLHPPVVRFRDDGKVVLVCGERRIKAMKILWGLGEAVRCGGEIFPEGQFPCNHLPELSELDAFEAELEENIRRADLSWQDRAAASAQLMDLRTQQAARDHKPEPTVSEIAQEVRGSATSGGSAWEATRKEILVSKFLSDPDVKKARTLDEGFKIVKRKEELRASADLGERIGRNFSKVDHTLFQGDCLEVMKEMPPQSFDVILTDPPYGIDAQKFNDSGASLGGGGGQHFYDDSYETWLELITSFAKLSFRVAKPQAHLYCFCDIDRFGALKVILSVQNWQCFRTPIIWHNPTSMRAPWPERGPQRKWQTCLYAIKGDRPVNRLYPDLITYPSDENLNHHAQKPVLLFADLLQRSIRPGDSVLDPFAGTGPIFPAAHGLKCKATGIELDAAAYGIALKRMQELE